MTKTDFLEWAYFCGVVFAFLSAAVVVMVVLWLLVIGVACLFRFLRTTKESS